jgi:hypothetical protein
MASTPGSGIPSRTTVAALVAGLVLLALVVAFAVGLPKASGEPEEGGATAQLATLPDTLPGGFVDLAGVGGPQGGDSAAIDYVNQVLGEVYPDEPTEFRVYVDQERQALLTVTLFAADGGAFFPPNGVADPQALGLDRAPTELVRQGEAVCEASYQSGAPGAASGGDEEPLAVSCQQPHDGTTVQIGSQGIGVDETVDLLGDLVTALG